MYVLSLSLSYGSSFPPCMRRDCCRGIAPLPHLYCYCLSMVRCITVSWQALPKSVCWALHWLFCQYAIYMCGCLMDRFYVQVMGRPRQVSMWAMLGEWPLHYYQSFYSTLIVCGSHCIRFPTCSLLTNSKCISAVRAAENFEKLALPTLKASRGQALELYTRRTTSDTLQLLLKAIPEISFVCLPFLAISSKSKTAKFGIT